jgi:RecJ-like exonuclease
VTRSNFKDLLEVIHEASDLLKEIIQKGSHILSLSHNDADGLASASIIAKMLARAEARFTSRIIKELDDVTVSDALKQKAELIIFTDIGSGQRDIISEHMKQARCLIIDHHPPLPGYDVNGIQVNPHDHGIDGTTEVSSSGCAYLVAREFSNSNTDLSPIAVVGALGDLQDKNEARALHGVNLQIVHEAVRGQWLKAEHDLVVYGRETRPLAKALAYTTNPYLPGLSGEEDNCLAVITSAGIPLKDNDRWRTVAELSMDEKQRLVSAIIDSLISKGFRGAVALKMIGTVYTLTKENPGSPTRDAREFASLLNACARMDRPSLAVAVCMGDRYDAFAEAQEIAASYRKMLAEYIRWINETPSAIRDLRAIVVIDGKDKINENMTGALSTILSSAGNLRNDKATVVLAKSKLGGIKISARAPETLLAKGVDLGKALHEVAKKYNGIGGGHNVAAGAHIASDVEDFFLATLDATILAQSEGKNY